MISDYQRLTAREWQQLAPVCECLKRWRTIEKIIRELYGKPARFVVVEDGDDELPFYFSVKDTTGESCSMDFTLPALAYYPAEWSQRTEDELRQYESEIYKEIVFSREWGGEWFPTTPDTYDLLQPPTVGGRDPELSILRETQQYEKLENLSPAIWLSEQYRFLEQWQRVGASVQTYYGEQARFVDFRRVHKDKDGSMEIGYMEVRDQENKELEVDIQRDWYSGYLEKQLVGWKERLQQTTKEGVVSLINDDVFQLIGECAGITESVQYDLLTPPVVVPDHLRLDLYRQISAPFLPD